MNYFNPRSPHGERLEVTEVDMQIILISIHAPRTGSDTRRRHTSTQQSDFNPRSPHGERPAACNPPAGLSPISIHAPRTGSDLQASRSGVPKSAISIHAPRTGSDSGIVMPQGRTRGGFQSTLPARGATTDGDAQAPPRKLSIHAPRTGSDCTLADVVRGTADFNPRSPHGERQERRVHHQRHDHISIHAPRTGSDQIKTGARPERTDFNPRSPHGERHVRR